MNKESETSFYIALFLSVNHVMKAEKMLIEKKVPIKIIPVPKSISSDCGVCIRFDGNIYEEIRVMLDKDFESVEYRKL